MTTSQAQAVPIKVVPKATERLRTTVLLRYLPRTVLTRCCQTSPEGKNTCANMTRTGKATSNAIRKVLIAQALGQRAR